MVDVSDIVSVAPLALDAVSEAEKVVAAHEELKARLDALEAFAADTGALLTHLFPHHAAMVAKRP